MTRICFVTEELYPVTPGGAGTLLHASFAELAARGHEVSFLLDVDEPTFARARAVYQDAASGVRAANLWHVETLVSGLPLPPTEAFGSWYAWRSYRLFVALSAICRSTRLDLVEFNDFFGPAYYALAGKLAGLAFEGVTLTVRVHNPFEALFMAGDVEAAQPYVLDIFALERGALRLAEQLHVPSSAYWEATAKLYDGPFLGRVVPSRPAVRVRPSPASAPGGEDASLVLFFGRLQPFKGVERLVAAMVEIAYQVPRLEFMLVGQDGGDPSGRSPSFGAELRRAIPPDLQPRFQFPGRMTHAELEAILPRVSFAVFPNYFESFCYAAHELSEAGVPLIVSDTPAFTDFFRHESTALVFDGTIGDLVAQMRRLADDPILRQRLRGASAAAEPALGAAYDQPALGYLDHRARGRLATLVVVVASNDQAGTALATQLERELRPDDAVVTLSPHAAHPGQAPVRILGEVFYLTTAAGEAALPSQVLTRDAVVFLQNEDRLEPGVLGRLQAVLATRPEVSFVRSWRTLGYGSGGVVDDCRPCELSLEEMLFHPQPFVSRTLMRTTPGGRLDDLFDLRAGALGEIDYLWRLAERGPGVTLPERGLECAAEPRAVPVERSPALSAYLVAKDGHPERQRALALRSLVRPTTPATDAATSASNARVAPVQATAAQEPGGRTLLRVALARLAARLLPARAERTTVYASR